MGLGSARVISLGEARELAHEARRLLARGVDSMIQRDADRRALSQGGAGTADKVGRAEATRPGPDTSP